MQWRKCPLCFIDFGWNFEEGLVGQVCECGHKFTQFDVIQNNDSELQLDKGVTSDIYDLAKEIVECMNDCHLSEKEKKVYLSNMLADLMPNYKRKD